MSSWLRLLMVCLLALAVPVQGMAAASMLHCGGSHGRMHDAQAHHHAPDASTDAVDQAQPVAEHHAEHHADHHPQHGTTADKFSDLAQYKCSACGACCAAAALPVTNGLVPDSRPLLQWQALPEAGHVHFLTSGPDRPPRSSRA